MQIIKKVLRGETDKEFGEAEEARDGWESGKLQWRYLMLQETLEGKPDQFQPMTGEGMIIVPVNH